jgi:hypothetical protein
MEPTRGASRPLGSHRENSSGIARRRWQSSAYEALATILSGQLARWMSGASTQHRLESGVTVPAPQLPVTIDGRSPFYSILIKREGVNTLRLSIGLLFTQELAGIFFGIWLVALGLATLILSVFGSRFCYDISDPAEVLVDPRCGPRTSGDRIRHPPSIH